MAAKKKVTKKVTKKVEPVKVGPLTVGIEESEVKEVETIKTVETITANLLTDQVRCPECNHVMLPTINAGKTRAREETLSCSNPRCENHKRRFRLPRVTLEVVENDK